jgi:hypothetical protein
VHGAVGEPRDRQIRRLIRERRGQPFVEIDTESGASPGCITPPANVYAWGNTRSVSGVCGMYSWMPKLWTLRSKWSAAAMHTGLRSVAPCDPVRT